MLVTSFVLFTLVGIYRSKRCGCGWVKGQSPIKLTLLLLILITLILVVVGRMYQPYSLLHRYKEEFINSSSDAAGTSLLLHPAYKVTFNSSIYQTKGNISFPSLIGHIKGGMGDQLFSYACAYAVARTLDLPLYIISVQPSSGNKSVVGDGLLLDNFRIPLLKVLDGGYGVDLPQDYLSDGDILSGSFGSGRVLHVTADCHSSEYFRSVNEDIVQLFRLKEEVQQREDLNGLSRMISNWNESVAVHISISSRDSTEWRPTIPVSFQQKAMVELSGDPRLTQPPQFFIFFTNNAPPSGVMKKVELELRNNTILPPDNLHFIYNLTLPQVMRLSLGCKHFVIPDNSFSWWVAYLGRPGKVVYAAAGGGRDKDNKSSSLQNSYYPSEWNVR